MQRHELSMSDLLDRVLVVDVPSRRGDDAIIPVLEVRNGAIDLGSRTYVRVPLDSWAYRTLLSVAPPNRATVKKNVYGDYIFVKI